MTSPKSAAEWLEGEPCPCAYSQRLLAMLRDAKAEFKRLDYHVDCEDCDCEGNALGGAQCATCNGVGYRRATGWETIERNFREGKYR